MGLSKAIWPSTGGRGPPESVLCQQLPVENFYGNLKGEGAVGSVLGGVEPSVGDEGGRQRASPPPAAALPFDSRVLDPRYGS